MERFAFVVHPLGDPRRDTARRFPFARFLPVKAVELFLRTLKPFVMSHITGVRSLTGEEAEGWFIACPLSARQMLKLPLDFVYRRLIKCGRMAEEMGAEIIGLGAFSSIVGDAGITVKNNLDIAVTTGNSYTVASSVEALIRAAETLGYDPRNCSAAVVGATGSIGKACSLILRDKVGKLILVGKTKDKVTSLLAEVQAEGQALVEATTEVASIKEADLIISATSAISTVIEPEQLKIGAVLCDVAQPRDVSRRVTEARDDVLVFDGGVIEVPGDVDFGLNFGFPPRMAYACTAETMILALDGRYESFTLGREIQPARVAEIGKLAAKHGFRVVGFRSFNRALSPEDVDEIRKTAARRKAAALKELSR